MASKEKDDVIKYLHAELDALEAQREKLHQSLLAVNEAITSISKALDHLEGENSLDVPDVLSDAAPVAPKQETRRPDECKLTLFKDVKLADAIVQVFQTSSGIGILSIDELIKKVYAAKNEEEEKACRASLTTALHRMEKGGIVKKVDAGVYQLDPDAEIEAKYREVTK